MKSKTTGKGSDTPGERRRLRGMFSGKNGKAIGFASIAAPIMTYAIHDLRKPDSIIRGLIGKAVNKLLPAKVERLEVIDVTDEVEVLDVNSNKVNQNKFSKE